MFFLYLNQNPQKINALLLQLNEKYPQVKKYLFFMGLSEEKQVAHGKSRARADHYYQLPLDASKWQELKNKN